jgi:mRNA interferase HigB
MAMHVVGLNRLDAFTKKHVDCKKWINCWVDEVRTSVWKSPQQIKQRFPSASFLAGNYVVFNVKGNNIRLVVLAVYEQKLIIVKWIGTHAEYSKKSFSI